MKPVIGIPLRYQKLVDNRAIVYLSERLRRTVQLAGGFVYSISPVQNLDNIHTKGNEFPELSDSEKEDINISLDMCDGIIFPGGIKFTPYDRYLFEMAIEKKIPVLGICLGMQEIGYYFNKKKIKPLKSLDHFDMNKDYLHTINLNKKGYLYSLLNKETIPVNSRHKYHLLENRHYTIEATCNNIIEAIKVKNKKYIIGLQFHPEIMYYYDDNAKIIFDDFFNQLSKN